MGIVKALYIYCTDFIINLANLTNLSYYEINTLIFGLLYPLLLISFLTLFFIQKRRLKKLKSPICYLHKN